MKTRSSTAKPMQRPRQAGAVAVEFALVVTFVWFPLLLGMIEMGWLLWTWNAATEATRFGARMAVVCDMNDAGIKTRMINMVPTMAGGDIKLIYDPANCTVDDCQSIQVSLSNFKYTPILLPITPTLPPFTTTLSRESLRSTFNGTPNPACQ
jgi:Flp pilus assembly protein TadG